MSDDLNAQKAKRILLGHPPPTIQCDHRGFLVPMVMIPQIISQPGPDGKPMKVTIFVTQSARCIKCPAMFTFGLEPPKPSQPEATQNHKNSTLKIKWMGKIGEFVDQIKTFRSKP